MKPATATTRSGLTEEQKMKNAQAAAEAAKAKSAAKQGMSGLLDSFKGMNFGAPAAMEEGGRRRRTRKHKHKRKGKGKGKKRGGENPCHDVEEEVKELKATLSNLRAVVGVGGRTRKRTHKRKH